MTASTPRSNPERFLSEIDLSEDGGLCPLCLSESARTPLFRIQDDPEISWLFCPDCRGYSASRMPTDRYLGNYYQDYYQPQETKVTVGRPARLARHVASLLPAQGRRDLSIFDFGGGDGTVAKLLAKALRLRNPGITSAITVVDFNQEEGGRTETYSLRFESNLNVLNGQRFDIILASAIVEHVPRAHDLLRDLFELLAPRGIFYARTPSVTPLKRLYKRYPLKYPMHVHDLGPSYWNRVCQTFPGMRLVVSQPSMVASGFSRAELARTSLAYLMKLPAHLENRIRRSPQDYFWNLAGGWEVLLQRADEPALA